jgi:gamma-glutamylcyclotransferase (GGCT)/AIG2-like uncharacterized protein YtfP
LSEQESRRLFVYGTLRGDPGQHYVSHLLEWNASILGEATVEGRLYDLGAYPGMTLTSDGRNVRGEVYEFAPDKWSTTIAQLDGYEGCAPGDPPPHEYRRQIVQATFFDGRRVAAWAYVLNRPTDGLPEIESGDWLRRKSK